VRKPRNVDDLCQCVKRVGGEVWVYCVECEHWKAVGIHSRAYVLFHQNETIKVYAPTEKQFVCSSCYADVDYLLTDIDRAYVMGKVRQ